MAFKRSGTPSDARRPEGLHVVTEYDRKSSRWIATFEEHGSKYLGLGSTEGEANEDLKDRDDQLGITPYEPPADWVTEDQLRDPAFMMNGGQAKAAAAIRQGRVRYEAKPSDDGPPETPEEDHLG